MSSPTPFTAEYQSEQFVDSVLANQVILETKSYKHGSAQVSMIQTYVNDEFIFYSFLYQLISAYAFYAIIYFLNKQDKSRLGLRSFDQTLVYAIIFMIFAHFLSEQKSLQVYSFIPLQNWHKLINVLLLIE